MGDVPGVGCPRTSCNGWWGGAARQIHAPAGTKIPAEELYGRQPGPRAYLSNVCTAAAARKQGIAAMLVGAAAEYAASHAISNLYVHVAVDNAAAQRLYQQCGFVVEQQESDGAARALYRPARHLLHRKLQQLQLPRNNQGLPSNDPQLKSRQ